MLFYFTTKEQQLLEHNTLTGFNGTQNLLGLADCVLHVAPTGIPRRLTDRNVSAPCPGQRRTSTGSPATLLTFFASAKTSGVASARSIP